MSRIFYSLIGAMIGGLPGFVIGFCIGYVADTFGKRTSFYRKFAVRHHRQAEEIFFNTTFSVMGHIAKADGRISTEEILLAEQVMREFGLDSEMQARAREFFNIGKRADFDLAGAMNELREVQWRLDILQIFLEIQIKLALIDGDMDSAEHDLLSSISAYLGFSAADFLHILQSVKVDMGVNRGDFGHPAITSINDAYAILSLKPGVDFRTIKQTYRRMMNKNHPDKLASQGLPEQMIRVATEKTQKIRSAYEALKKHHETSAGAGLH